LRLSKRRHKVEGVVVIYARGSESNALWEYALRRRWEDEVEAVSDANALLKLVRLGRVGVALCYSLCGLARSVPELIGVLREFVSCKVVLIIPSRGIDTSKVALGGLLDAIEEFQQVATVEAIQEGLAAAKARGTKLGRPRTLDAYREDVARLKTQGLSGRGIARTLGLPVGSVFGILRHLSDNSASSTPRRNIDVIKK
jgi:DNA invertase Pin-like site-specific DNA recombinase